MALNTMYILMTPKFKSPAPASLDLHNIFTQVSTRHLKLNMNKRELTLTPMTLSFRSLLHLRNYYYQLLKPKPKNQRKKLNSMWKNLENIL
jgi:hypothetical protein